MTGKHIVCLNEDAKPFTILTSARIPLALLQNAKSKLEHMDELGVIRRDNVLSDAQEW